MNVIGSELTTTTSYYKMKRAARSAVRSFQSNLARIISTYISMHNTPMLHIRPRVTFASAIRPEAVRPEVEIASG